MEARSSSLQNLRASFLRPLRVSRRGQGRKESGRVWMELVQSGLRNGGASAWSSSGGASSPSEPFHPFGRLARSARPTKCPCRGVATLFCEHGARGGRRHGGCREGLRSGGILSFPALATGKEFGECFRSVDTPPANSTSKNPPCLLPPSPPCFAPRAGEKGERAGVSHVCIELVQSGLRNGVTSPWHRPMVGRALRASRSLRLCGSLGELALPGWKTKQKLHCFAPISIRKGPSPAANGHAPFASRAGRPRPQHGSAPLLPFENFPNADLQWS